MTSIFGFLEKHFYGPVHTPRAKAMLRIVLLILAFDVWLELGGHAGRYGAGDFNLSHFDWLDALQPMPSPGLYLGVIFGVGLLSFVRVWLAQPRWVMGVLCAAYTYAWAMSMHDSYQHHYLLSVVLFCFVFFPKNEPAATASATTSDEATTWAYPMLTSSIAIVYFYAAFAKLDPAWQSGDAFVRVAPDYARTLFAAAAEYDIARETVLSFIGTSVVGVQIVLGLSYLAAPWYDREIERSTLRRILQGSAIAAGVLGALLVIEPIRQSGAGSWLTVAAYIALGILLVTAAVANRWMQLVPLFLALSFHFGAEELGLKIGWFSYYMIVIALLVLGPPQITNWIVRSQRALVRSIEGIEFKERGVLLTLMLVCVALATYIAASLDLPGVAWGIALCGLVLCARPLQKMKNHPELLALTGAAILIGSVTMWTAVSNAEVRYDYYRFLGGDLRRRGDLEGALDAYVRANRYAPEGKGRKEKEEQLRRALGQK